MPPELAASVRSAAARKFWSDKDEGGHRHTEEAWLATYAGELIEILGAPGGALLDVGCGSCQLTTHLAGAFDEVIAVDFSETMLAAARKRLAATGQGKVRLLTGTMQAFPPQVGGVGVVLSYGVLQYLRLEDLAAHLAECRRVLAPDGVVCIANIPNRRRRGLYRRAIMVPRPGGRLGGLKQWAAIGRRRLGGWLRRDFLWDNIGNWFTPEQIAAAAAAAGFRAEFHDARHYEYRFHAVLWPEGCTRARA